MQAGGGAMPVSACVKTCGTSFSTVRALPFISPRGSRILSGAPIGGLVDIFDIVHSGALNATDL